MGAGLYWEININTILFFHQEADESSVLGRLQNQLVIFDLDQQVYAGQLVFKEYHAAINYRRPFQIFLHHYFSQVCENTNYYQYVCRFIVIYQNSDSTILYIY